MHKDPIDELLELYDPNPNYEPHLRRHLERKLRFTRSSCIEIIQIISAVVLALWVGYVIAG
jgi:hypothetical protein